MRPSSAKAKGRRLQQETVAAIIATFPHLVADDDVGSRSMGAGGIDITLSTAAKRVFPFSVENKCVEALNIWAALAQAEENVHPGTAALCVFRRNKSVTYAALKFSDLLLLVRDAAAGRLL